MLNYWANELIITGIITYFMSIIFEQIVRNDQALVIKTKSNIIGRSKIKNFHSLNVCGSFLKNLSGGSQKLFIPGFSLMIFLCLKNSYRITGYCFLRILSWLFLQDNRFRLFSLKYWMVIFVRIPE